MTSPLAIDIDFAHSTMGNLYRASPLKIKLFNKKAVAEEYNRSISDEGINQLDRKGTNLLQLLMPLHTNFAGKNTVRVMAFLKMRGKDEPETVCLDISHKDWREFGEKNEPITKKMLEEIKDDESE
jgi:hypothetical protein